MRMTCLLLIGLLCFGGGVQPALAEDAPGEAKPDPIVGTWTVITPYGGQDMESSLEIRRGEDGKLSGTYVDAGGRSCELRDPVFADGVLRFLRTAGPREFRFVGKVKGDRMDGVHMLGRRNVEAMAARGTEAIAALRAERLKATERSDDIEEDYKRHSMRAAPRDAFPVLFDPKLTPAAEVTDIDDDEPVIGIAMGGEAKAYPISIMGRHELANDTCGGRPITASW